MNDQQMRAIVEAAGECWHEGSHYCTEVCIKCGVFLPHRKRPSPNDLNELFRLAEKLGFKFAVRRLNKGFSAMVKPSFHSTEFRFDFADTPADALREALYQAIKEV